MQVLRESFSNVLIHTQAKRVSVHIQQGHTGYTMIVTNPGEYSRPVVFGTGLTGLQQRIEKAQGTMQVDETGDFTLKIFLPATLREASTPSAPAP